MQQHRNECEENNAQVLQPQPAADEQQTRVASLPVGQTITSDPWVNCVHQPETISRQPQDLDSRFLMEAAEAGRPMGQGPSETLTTRSPLTTDILEANQVAAVPPYGIHDPLAAIHDIFNFISGSCTGCLRSSDIEAAAAPTTAAAVPPQQALDMSTFPASQMPYGLASSFADDSYPSANSSNGNGNGSGSGGAASLTEPYTVELTATATATVAAAAPASSEVMPPPRVSSAVDMKLTGCETGLQTWGSPAGMPSTPTQRLQQGPLQPLLMSPQPPPPLPHSLPLFPDLYCMHTQTGNGAADSHDATSMGMDGANMYSDNVYGGGSGGGNDGGIGDAAAQMEAFAYLPAQHVQLLAARAPDSNENRLQPGPPQPAPFQTFPYQHNRHDLGFVCRQRVEIPELQSPEQQQQQQPSEQQQQKQQSPVAEPPHMQLRGRVEVPQPGQSLDTQPFPRATGASISSGLAAPSPISCAFDSSFLTHIIPNGPPLAVLTGPTAGAGLPERSVSFSGFLSPHLQLETPPPPPPASAPPSLLSAAAAGALDQAPGALTPLGIPPQLGLPQLQSDAAAAAPQQEHPSTTPSGNEVEVPGLQPYGPCSGLMVPYPEAITPRLIASHTSPFALFSPPHYIPPPPPFSERQLPEQTQLYQPPPQFVPIDSGGGGGGGSREQLQNPQLQPVAAPPHRELAPGLQYGTVEALTPVSLTPAEASLKTQPQPAEAVAVAEAAEAMSPATAASGSEGPARSSPRPAGTPQAAMNFLHQVLNDGGDVGGQDERLHDLLHSLDSPPGAGTQVPYSDGVDGGGGGGADGGDLAPRMAHVDDADSGAAAERAYGGAGDGDAAAALTPASLEYGDRADHNPAVTGGGAGSGGAERQGSNMAAPERWLNGNAASPADAGGAVQAAVVIRKLEEAGQSFDNDGGAAPLPPLTSGFPTLPESGALEEQHHVLQRSMSPWRRETGAGRCSEGALTQMKTEQSHDLDRTAGFQSWDEKVLEPASAAPFELNRLTPPLASGQAWHGMAVAPSAAVPVTGYVSMDEMILGGGRGDEHNSLPPSRQTREVVAAAVAADAPIGTEQGPGGDGGDGGGGGGGGTAIAGLPTDRRRQGGSGAPPVSVGGFHPDWLVVLTTDERFFQPCASCNPQHPGSRDALMTYLDLTDPYSAGVCNYCRAARIKAGHRLLQVRRSTYHEVVQVADVASLLDLRGVQLYTINHARVVFLRSRPQARPPKGAAMPSRCELDGRQLMDVGARFCSLRCKIEREPDDIFLDPDSPAAVAVRDHIQEIKRTEAAVATATATVVKSDDAAPPLTRTASRPSSPYTQGGLPLGGGEGSAGARTVAAAVAALPKGPATPPLAAPDASGEALTADQTAICVESRGKRRRTEAIWPAAAATATAMPGSISFGPSGGRGGRGTTPIINLTKHRTAGPSSASRRAAQRWQRQLELLRNPLPISPNDEADMGPAPLSTEEQRQRQQQLDLLKGQQWKTADRMHPGGDGGSGGDGNVAISPVQQVEPMVAFVGGPPGVSAAVEATREMPESWEVQRVLSVPTDGLAAANRSVSATAAAAAAAASSSGARGGYGSDGVDGPHGRQGAFEYHGSVAEYGTGGAEGLELLGRAAVRACTRQKPRVPIPTRQQATRPLEVVAAAGRATAPPALPVPAGAPTVPSPCEKSTGRHARFGPAPTTALGGISLLQEPPAAAAAAMEHLRPSPSTTATTLGYGAGRQESEAMAGAAAGAPEWALRPLSSFVGGGGEGGDGTGGGGGVAGALGLLSGGRQDSVNGGGGGGSGYVTPEMAEHRVTRRNEHVAAALAAAAAPSPQRGQRSTGSFGSFGGGGGLPPLPGLEPDPLTGWAALLRPPLPPLPSPQRTAHAQPQSLARQQLSLPCNDAVLAEVTVPKSPGQRRSTSKGGPPSRSPGRGGGGGDGGSIRAATTSGSRHSHDSGDGDTRSTGSHRHPDLPLQPHLQQQHHHHKRKGAPHRSALE